MFLNVAFSLKRNSVYLKKSGKPWFLRLADLMMASKTIFKTSLYKCKLINFAQGSTPLIRIGIYKIMQIIIINDVLKLYFDFQSYYLSQDEWKNRKRKCSICFRKITFELFTFRREKRLEVKFWCITSERIFLCKQDKIWNGAESVTNSLKLIFIIRWKAWKMKIN